MARWIYDIQGIREILNAAGAALTRRKTLQFGSGFSAGDDGSKTVVTLGSPSEPFALQTAALARGVGLRVDPDGKLSPRFRPRKVRISEHFISGLATSGNIGAYGWALSGSSPNFARQNETASSGLAATNRALLTTGASTNDTCIICLGDATNRAQWLLSDLDLAQCVVSMNGSLATKGFFFGFASDLAAAPAGAADNLGIFYDSSAGSQWRLIARVGSSNSPVVSAVNVDASAPTLLTIERAGSEFSFYVGATFLGSIVGTSTANMNFGARLSTLTTAARTCRLGYLGLEASIGGAYDDDSQFEA